MLGLTLSLAACGGGGGGGGGSGGGSGGTAFTISGMAGDAKAQPAPAPGQTAEALASSGSGVQSKLKSGSGYDPHNDGDFILKVESNGSLALKVDNGVVIATNFKLGDMRFYNKDGVDFAVMMDAPQTLNVNEPDLKGTIKSKNALWIGKLEYASFGYWAWVADIQGTFEGNPVKGTARLDYDYFYEGKKANYSSGNLSFTGIALGTATYGTENSAGAISFGTIPLVGTASLNITNASNGSLVLTFPNFYKLTGEVRTYSDGRLSGDFTTWQKLGSASPVDLPATAGQLDSNYIHGQLYGSSPSTPTEAAGAWGVVYDTDTKFISANGVFGVKKK